MKNTKLKKTGIAVLALCLVAIVGAGATLAYFTAQANKENKFKIGTVDVTVEEPNFPEETPEIQPQQIVFKDPAATNEGSGDAYVRMTVTIPTFVDAKGQTQPMFYFGTLKPTSGVKKQADGKFVDANGKVITGDSVKAADCNLNSGDISSAYHSDKWELVQDPSNPNVYVFYYKSIVAPGESTEAAFDLVQFNPAYKYTGGSVDTKIDVLAQAIQTKGLEFTPAADHTDAYAAFQVTDASN